MKPTAFVDMDGVLVNFAESSLKFHGKYLHPRDITWDFPVQVGFASTWAPEFWNPLQYDFWQGLPWIDEGKALLAGIEALFGQDRVAPLSSPVDVAGCADGKFAWLKRELPRYHRQNFLGTAKHLAAGPTKVLIDDNDKNVDQFRAHGGRAVLVPRSWNKRKDRIDDLGRFDVAALLAELESEVAAISLL